METLSQKSTLFTGKNLYYLLTASAVGASSYLFQNKVLYLIGVYIVTVYLGSHTIPLLTKIKAGQSVREDGPKSHLVKTGTPTLGGVFLILPTLLISLMSTGFNKEVVGVSILTLFYFLIGFADDYKIIREKCNKGLSARAKLVFQTLFGAIFVAWSLWQFGSTITVGVNVLTINPVLYYCIGLFLLVGFSNATNITDGLDGLCSGISLIIALFVGLMLFPLHPQLSLMMIIFAGSNLGFLHYNSNKAQVFMGDCGSLAIGGLFTSIALVSGEVLPIIIMSSVFILETLSVMIQVSYFKHTKKKTGEGVRFFKMAPFHHHLEMSGFNEVSVNILAYMTTFVLGLLVLATGI